MTNCEECTKKNLWQSTGKIKNGRRLWRCRNCGHEQWEYPPQGLDIPPKILYLDIEYGKMKVWLYDLYQKGNTRINHEMIDRAKFVTNWAAAWVKPHTYTIKGSIMSGVVSPQAARTGNDKAILKPLFNLMDEADYWCHHNGKSFDIKVLKWRFLYHNFGYPVESKQVDTLTMAGRSRPESRSLDYLLKQLGYKGKTNKLSDTEWREICEKGTPKLLAKADRYCRQDVRGGVNLLREYVLAEEQSGRVVFR